MARTDNLTNFLTDIADTIRSKTGSQSTILAEDFDTEITTIATDGTATADDIINPKTAYSQSGKITGAIMPNYGSVESSLTYKSTTTVTGTYPAVCMTKDYKLLLVTDGDGICSYILGANGYEKTNYSATASQCGHSYSNIRGIRISPIEFDTNKVLVVTTSFSTDSTYGNLEIAMFLVNKNTGEIYTDKVLSKTNISNNAGCIAIAMSNLRADLFVMETSNNRYKIVVNNSFTNYTITELGRPYGSWCFLDCYFTQNDKLLVTTSKFGTRDGGRNVITVMDNTSYTTGNSYSYSTKSQIAVSYDNSYMINNCDLYTLSISSGSLTATNVKSNFCTKMLSGSGAVNSGYAFVTFDNSGDFVIVSSFGTGATIYKFDKTNYTLTQVVDDSTAPNVTENGLGKLYSIVCTNPIIFRGGTTVKYTYVESDNVLLSLERKTINFYNTAYDSNGTASDLLQGKILYGSSGKITGTMPNNGALNYTPTSSEQIIPAGYTSGGIVGATSGGETILNVTGDDASVSGTTLVFGSLPYTELEYIESTGTQYIDTNISISTTSNSGNTKMELKIKFEQTDTNERVIIASNNNSNIWFLAYNGTNAVYANSNYNWTASLTSTQKTSPFIISSNVANIYADSTLMASNYRTNSTFRFFRSPDNWTQNYSGIYKLYYCKIWDKDENLIADFIPVKDSNNVVCLYDKIGEDYYYNAGTGTFTAGPEV